MSNPNERAWQFLTMLSHSKNPTVSLYGYENKRLLELLPTAQHSEIIKNADEEPAAFIYDRKSLINGLKLKYQFHSKNMNE